MASLKDLLDQSGEEKTASAAQANQASAEQTGKSDEEIMKLATDFGIYNELFPQDASLSDSSEKTAEEVKMAEYQEALGARAYDYCAMRFDSRIEKIAGEIMSSSDLEVAQGIMQPSASAPQRIPNNQDLVGDKVPRILVGAGDTPYPNPLRTGFGVGEEGQVGHEEQQKMAACLRKHFILSQIQG